MYTTSRRSFLRQTSQVAVASLLPTSLWTFSGKVSKASVHINLNQSRGTIEPEIYGQFIEYLGRSITGGIVDAKTNQVRNDVLAKVKRLDPPVLRFPGGTVTKIYHWQDGVGPKATRPIRPNLIWGGEENNQFGTNEFIQYCRQLKTDPFLVVNMNTGTPEEASNWVEYCNGKGKTSFAELRRKHGFTNAHGVKYWGLGNEENAGPDTGRLQDPATYAEAAWQFAKLMKLQDPSIKLIMAGHDEKWNEVVLKELHPIADYISMHLYASSKKGQPATLFTQLAGFEKQIEDTHRQIKRLAPEKVEKFDRWYRFPPRSKGVKLAIDEWGIWENEGKGTYNLEVTYQWFHALGVASFLNLFQRQAEILTMATWAQTVNVLAPILSNDHESICQTVFYPLELYRQYCKGVSLQAEVKSETLQQSGGEELPMLDSSASFDEKTGMATLALVNRHPDMAIETSIEWEGSARLNVFERHELTASGFTVFNTLENPKKEVVKYQKKAVTDNPTLITVPPASITLLRYKVV